MIELTRIGAISSRDFFLHDALANAAKTPAIRRILWALIPG